MNSTIFCFGLSVYANISVYEHRVGVCTISNALHTTCKRKDLSVGQNSLSF